MAALIGQIQMAALIGQIQMAAQIGQIQMMALIGQVQMAALIGQIQMAVLIGQIQTAALIGQTQMAALIGQFQMVALIGQILMAVPWYSYVKPLRWAAPFLPEAHWFLPWVSPPRLTQVMWRQTEKKRNFQFYINQKEFVTQDFSTKVKIDYLH